VSDALYSTRLRWDGRHGIAKLHGATVLLHASVDLGQGAVYALDYVPEVHIAEIVPRACDRRRDMTPAEITAADALLVRLLQALPTE
jgi:hypothetical protein